MSPARGFLLAAVGGSGHGHRPQHQVGFQLEGNARRPRRATQRILCLIARVFRNQTPVVLKRYPAERAVGTRVHRWWRERSREDAAYEYENLIRARSAHPVVRSCALDDENARAALIGSDQVPSRRGELLVSFQLGSARAGPATW